MASNNSKKQKSSLSSSRKYYSPATVIYEVPYDIKIPKRYPKKKKLFHIIGLGIAWVVVFFLLIFVIMFGYHAWSRMTPFPELLANETLTRTFSVVADEVVDAADPFAGIPLHPPGAAHDAAADNVDVPPPLPPAAVVAAPQCNIKENNRFDCWPEIKGATEEKCQNRGCCWQKPSIENTAPSCFFPSNYEGYKATDVKQTATGIDATLVRTTTTFFSPDVKTLKLLVEYQTDTRLRVKLYDPNNARFEPPLDVPTGSQGLENPLYDVAIHSDPFNIVITRKSTGATVFDTTGTAPLIFSDQYLQITTQLSTKYLYGFGEHRDNFLQDPTVWRRLVFWTRDDNPKVDNNGYGSHPFFLNLESDTGISDAHGVFLLNSNAGEVAMQPYGTYKTGAVTYRFIGGILDFFIFLGPSPVSVVSQLTGVIGQPYFPPFWSLGFHICKYGIQNVTDLKDLIDRNRAADMPYDVQWGDIDYMSKVKDWTVDSARYTGLPDVVEDLHDHQQRYIIIVDPSVSSTQTPGSYPPYDDGKQLDVFVKNASGDIIFGMVWPGLTAFPDFFHPNSYGYWYKSASEFHAKLSFDGLWLDMNEPSSFVTGSSVGCTNSSLDNPPYIPPTIDGGKLQARTLCPSAKHVVSTHYNLHNMYGWSESNVTRAALDAIFPNKRSPIISRSTFPGSGRFTGHWLGDNHSTYHDMYFSISGILNFNLFGIPFVGVDTCGFSGITTPDLCTRWHQLAVFYPFMRNHADLLSPYQDPAIFSEPHRSYIRSALQLRYRLLAVLYTAFFKAHTEGLPIVRPLFFLYPATQSIDRQFMWTDQLLVSPVLELDKTSVPAYIPDDIWYDFYNGSLFVNTAQYVQLDAPISHINVHVRGGSILPLLPATIRTDIARQQKFQLLVAPNKEGNAGGELFWDDGESADSISDNKYSHIFFSLETSDTLDTKTFKSSAARSDYNPPNGVRLGQITFLGVEIYPSDVTVNNKATPFSYNNSSKVLTLNELNEDLLQPLTIIFK